MAVHSSLLYLGLLLPSLFAPSACDTTCNGDFRCSEYFDADAQGKYSVAVAKCEYGHIELDGECEHGCYEHRVAPCRCLTRQEAHDGLGAEAAIGIAISVALTLISSVCYYFLWKSLNASAGSDQETGAAKINAEIDASGGKTLDSDAEVESTSVGSDADVESIPVEEILSSQVYVDDSGSEACLPGLAAEPAGIILHVEATVVENTEAVNVQSSDVQAIGNSPNSSGIPHVQLGGSTTDFRPADLEEGASQVEMMKDVQAKCKGNEETYCWVFERVGELLLLGFTVFIVAVIATGLPMWYVKYHFFFVVSWLLAMWTVRLVDLLFNHLCRLRMASAVDNHNHSLGNGDMKIVFGLIASFTLTGLAGLAWGAWRLVFQDGIYHDACPHWNQR